MKYDFDIDIDVADRDLVLSYLKHTPASINNNGKWTKHNTGVYFQTIPSHPLEGISSIDYKTAEQDGWFKVDFLNNNIYKNIRSEAHLNHLLKIEPLWDLLEHEEVVEQLYHINNYASVVAEYKPKSVQELAMLLAVIRPAKKHLLGKSFEEISKTVWDKPAGDEYYFKKAHAIAFATAIVVQLNALCEKAHSVYA